MTHFQVWLAKDTLLYLPVYALADLGVLDRVAKTLQVKDPITIDIKPAPEKGDRGAIKTMIAEANSSEDDQVHIAICDPMDSYWEDPTGEEVALLGAFIKRPTFWMIGRANAGDMKPDDVYVYYDESYSTGNQIGRVYTAGVPHDNRRRCLMGDEFKQLMPAADPTGRTHVLTADVVGLVEIMSAYEDVKIQKKAKDDPAFRDYITTAVLSHKRYLSNGASSLQLFMEAVRFSCVLLRSAQAPSAALISHAIQSGREARAALTHIAAGSSLPVEELAKGVAHRLFEDEIYSDTLCVTPTEWRNTVRTREWGADHHKAKAESLFSRIYAPRIAGSLTGRWLMSSFKDYGRYVTNERRARRSSAASVAGLITTLLALYLIYNGTDNLRQEFHLIFVSAVIAGTISLASALILFARTPLGVRVGTEMFLSRDWNASKQMIVALGTFLFATAALIAAHLIFHVELEWPLIIWYGATAIAVLLANVWLLMRRHA